MPFTSRKSVGIMAQTLLQKPFNDSQLPSIICVAAYSGYFLQEIILSKGDQTGLEDQLRIQALEYFGTARVAISRLLMQTPATLRNLQALTFGVSHIYFGISYGSLLTLTTRFCLNKKPEILQQLGILLKLLVIYASS